MKIQLDYDNKTLKLENGVNMGEFFKRVKSILPDWKDWELKTGTIINWSSPVVIEKHYPRPWWEANQVFCTNGADFPKPSVNNESRLSITHEAPTDGIYCLELKN